MLHQKTRQITWFLFILFTTLLLAACQTGTQDDGVVTQQEGVVEAGAGESGNLVIYSGRSDSLVQPIIDQFAIATGINVEVRYGSTSEIAGVLLEEGENSPADIFYASTLR